MKCVYKLTTIWLECIDIWMLKWNLKNLKTNSEIRILLVQLYLIQLTCQLHISLGKNTRNSHYHVSYLFVTSGENCMYIEDNFYCCAACISRFWSKKKSDPDCDYIRRIRRQAITILSQRWRRIMAAAKLTLILLTWRIGWAHNNARK